MENITPNQVSNLSIACPIALINGIANHYLWGPFMGVTMMALTFFGVIWIRDWRHSKQTNEK